MDVYDAVKMNTRHGKIGAAAAKLGELSTGAEGLGESIKQLPEEARGAVGGLIAQGLVQLKALVEKASSIPGVADVMKPKLDELMAKLTALSEN